MASTRITGMYSGMDTESIISELVKAKSTKVEKLKKEKTKLEWKQTAWQDLNKKIYSLYSKTLSELRYSSNYKVKKATASNGNAVSVTGRADAVNGVQIAKVNFLAKAGYLTGAKLEKVDGSAIKSTDKIAEALDFEFGPNGKASFTVFKDKNDEKGTQIDIDSDTTFKDLVAKLSDAGLNANFDEKNQRLFLSSKETGAENDFNIVNSNSNGNSMLAALGLASDAQELAAANFQKVRTLNTQIAVLQSGGIDDEIQARIDKLQAQVDELKKTYDESVDANGNTMITASQALKDDKSVRYASRIAGTDAEIELNGAIFTSKTNSFSINGLEITANAVTAEEFTITTQDDYDGMYDKIKAFIKEYNELMNEMDKLYNADSSKGYEPLTDEEKDAMSETEIEKWEEKIKDSLLRKDESLGKMRTAYTGIMTGGITVNGKTMYLANFGVATLGYFNAEENERHAYHIDGDADDDTVSAKDNKLKTMIKEEPETVIEFFSSLAKSLYEKTDKLMASTDYSSIYKVYNDKQLKKDYTAYDSKISEAEKKLTAYEDRWYKKFGNMETALAKLSSKESSIAGFFS